MLAKVDVHEFRKHDYESWSSPDLAVIHVRDSPEEFVDIKIRGEGTLHVETPEMIQGLVDALSKAGYRSTKKVPGVKEKK